MTLPPISLDDRYTAQSGRVLLSGVQALVRLPMVQRRRDLAAGLDTAGFVSGYRGSPLGTYDVALNSARKFLDEHRVRFSPGVNEDLAATALWGTQQVTMYDGATVDGVFGIWYGKGPGVDRSTDAFKHANLAGTSKHGGVLVVAGDDHGCQSSTTAHQSEQVLIAALIPVLNPATVQDYLDLGLVGFALSRFSGCWVGFKAIAESVESSATVDVDPDRVKIVLPHDFATPPGGLNIRWPDAPLEQERRLHGPKMDAVLAFARANRIDRVVIDSPRARLGIAATGKGYLDVRQALFDLGLSEEDAAGLGIRLYKIGLSWPLEPHGARAFAAGLDHVLVVEEKRALLEDQLAKALYALDRRPRIVGKQDDEGRPLLPSAGELSPAAVAGAIVDRLEKIHGPLPALRERLARLQRLQTVADTPATYPLRTPFFCSGCPHNTSTKVPEGSRALAGIGCHTLAIYMPSRRTATFSHMGGEGAAWIGQAAFTREKHVFQNLGDGTYFHSGLLAIRAAAAAGVNITYKILYNDAVAMTGGQAVDGPLSVAQITRQVAAEGAGKIVVVTDEPEKHRSETGFAQGVTVRHRKELDAVQRELRETPGLTVLIYDQTCAAEKRRRRKRGRFPDPDRRVFINDAVCEGCGDCSEASNCVSVRPLETEFGRKRTIDQSACNKDYSCLDGFCPSFVTVHGGRVRATAANSATPPDVPMPGARMPHIPSSAESVGERRDGADAHDLAEPYGILVTGIGGTGVLTVGALLGMAAHLEGKACTTLDFTGMAQKNGAVTSHVRIARSADDLHAVRIALGGARLVLGCDLTVAAAPSSLARIEPGVTRAVINATTTPTAAFVLNGDIDLQSGAMRAAIVRAAGGQVVTTVQPLASGQRAASVERSASAADPPASQATARRPGATDEPVDFVDASRIATALAGDSIATNVFMLGYAFQKGLIPLGLEALLRAIELNGASVEKNKAAFAWGRLAAHDPAAVERLAGIAGVAASETAAAPATLHDLVERRARFLVDYQDEAYASRFRRTVERAISAEARVPGRTGFAEAVARSLFKLMAYKDEYEVARLHSDPGFRRKLDAQFEGGYALHFHLAPPLFAKRDPATGRLVKREYGAWMSGALRVLARLKGLRGTALDPFGRTAERREERALIGEFEALAIEACGALEDRTYGTALELAAAPMQVRGFGHVKQRNVEQYRERVQALRSALREAPRKAETVGAERAVAHAR